MGARRTESVTASRRLRRGTATALAVTLLSLTAAAVLGSWRQAVIVQTMADASTRTDAYQRAAQLGAMEMALLERALRKPGGPERAAAAEVGQQFVDALDAMAATDAEHSDLDDRLGSRQRTLQPLIAYYLLLLDRGNPTAARQVLEERIEPIAEEISATLQAEQAHHVEEYLASVAQAQRDSRLLQAGTLLIFLLGLGVLATLGWSARSHRRQIERMAAYDSLTGLPNRAEFHARAEAAMATARMVGQQPTILVLDLDGFKDVNDSLGHHVGDLLLIEVGKRLQACVRGQDSVARVGGDEFAVVLVDADPAVGEQVATRIAQALNRPFVIEDITLDIEVSIGITTAESNHDLATVVRYADTAMYAAKEHRLGHARFDPEQAHDTTARLTLLGDLRRALDVTDEIRLYYQPKVAVDTGELIGAEALARWQHPTRGLVAPNDFIPVLEGTNLVHRFTSHVLALALAQARSWLEAGYRVPTAVNVSTRCLLDAAFPETVRQALHAQGVPGELLCIEITENTVMADPERAIEVLRRIRALGVKVAIDDFGTGYSSMAYLKILPVDEIKVDRSFVRDMAVDRSNYVLVESAVDLGHNLGLAVVAEGVENHPTVAALHELGCDIAQGYHFARPLPPDAFATYLAEHASATVSGGGTAPSTGCPGGAAAEPAADHAPGVSTATGAAAR